LVEKQAYLSSNAYRNPNGEISMGSQRKKREDIRKNHFSQAEFEMILVQYAKCCKKIDTFVSMTRIHEISKKREFLKDEKNFAKIMDNTVESFKHIFANLPEDSSLHGEALEAFYQQLERKIQNDGNDPRCVEKFLRCKEVLMMQYNEWMRQDQEGTLDKSLSFHREDKEIIKAQEEEIEVEKNRSKKETVFLLGAILAASFVGLTMIENSEPQVVKNQQVNVSNRHKVEEVVKASDSEKALEDDFDKTGTLIFASALALSGTAAITTYKKIKKIREENQELEQSTLDENTKQYEIKESEEKTQLRRRRRNAYQIAIQTSQQEVEDRSEESLLQSSENQESSNNSTPRRRRRRNISQEDGEIDI